VQQYLQPPAVKRSFRDLALRGALTVAAIVIAAAILHNALFGAVGAYLVKSVPPEKADVALVLAGDFFGNRILKGGDLVRQGYVPRVLVSGPSGSYGMHECEPAIAFAVRAGYPVEYFVHVEHNARSTEEEAVPTIAAIRQSGAHRVLLVTSDYHTRRSGNVFRRAAPDLEFLVVAAPDVDFSPQGWWHTRQGRKVALYEWMKTVADWLGI
jgi:uncharacterized SAM-binding protein YcdF (DUF218 family)